MRHLFLGAGLLLASLANPWAPCLFEDAFAADTAAEIIPSPGFSSDELKAYPVSGWLTNGGNLYNQRYSPLDEINRETVGDLQAEWRVRLGGSGAGPQHSGEAQPIVHEGVVYIVTGADDVFAISIEQGEILWEYKANLTGEDAPSVCCGWTSRGVGLGEGKVFVGQLDAKLVALDQKTGEIAWSAQVEDPHLGYSITSAPLYYDGMVITGAAGADAGTRGFVAAYSARDGSELWRFFTVPAPGEFGSDTWPDNDYWKYGGANVWQTPAVDPDTGLVYFSTANSAPDFNGAMREGDNLFGVSILAIEAASGKYRWHYQMVHHDIWDYDAPNPVVLFDIELDGRKRKALAQAGKTGWVYILDRESGEPLIGIEERPVPQDDRQKTAATQPYPVGDAFVPQEIDIAPEGFTLVNGGRIFTPYWTEGSVMKPGSLGGANWPPSSYNPTTGILYVCANDQVGLYRGGHKNNEEIPTREEGFVGGDWAGVPIPITGIFTAMDMRTNRIVWQQRWADLCYSGSLATAGGLLFVGRNDGSLTALDSSNGERLWEFQTGAGVNTTASTFEHEGDQYVVIYSAGNMFAATPRGDSVWLFSLKGELGPSLPPGSAPPSPMGPLATYGPGEGPSAPPDGELIYNNACRFCHGFDGSGGHNGDSLLTAAGQGRDYIYPVVRDGRNTMPAFRAMLTDEEIEAVSVYVSELPAASE